MILIVGRTGDLGSLITRRTLATGEPVRLLARRHHSDNPSAASGAELMLGDLRDPDSLRDACVGVDTVVTTATAAARSAPDTLESVDMTGNVNLIEAAEAAGVRQFLLVSALGASPDHPMPLLRAKGRAEQRLLATAMAWTVLQPDVFMDRLIPIVVGGPALDNRPVTLVGSGHHRHSFVAMRDVADYAVAAIRHPRAQRQVIRIGGPQSLSWDDIIKTFEHELARSIPVRRIGPGDPDTGLPGFVVELLTALDGYDSPIDMTRTGQDFGIEPTPISAFVHDHVSSTRSRLRSAG